MLSDDNRWQSKAGGLAPQTYLLTTTGEAQVSRSMRHLIDPGSLLFRVLWNILRRWLYCSDTLLRLKEDY